jgi:purine-binding chemotaxis protein CheW
MGEARSMLSVFLTRLEGLQIGFPAAAVREIVRAVAIVSLPGAPEVVEGVINLHGQIVTVVDLRHRLALSSLPVEPEQFLVILQSSDRLIAVRVDDVEDVIDLPVASLQSADSLSPVLQRLQGVAPIASGAIVIYDVDTFLTQAERDALAATALVTA